MTLPDFRIVVGDLRAERSKRDLFVKQKPSSIAARQGLRYENRVGKELQRHVEGGRFLRLEHNPWFTFTDLYGSANCAPDFLLHTEREIIIVEVKLTWVDVAIHKLNDLYGPVISTALGRTAIPLIICRNTAPQAPPAKYSLSEALTSSYRLLQWPDTGRLQW